MRAILCLLFGHRLFRLGVGYYQPTPTERRWRRAYLCERCRRIILRPVGDA